MEKKRGPFAKPSFVALVRRQGGVVSRAQLVAAGIDSALIRRRVATGMLADQGADVFAVGHAMLTDHGLRHSALLAAGTGSALSHWTAAFIWGLIEKDPNRVHVSTATRSTRRRCRRVEIHRPRRLPADDTTTRSGCRITTIQRTLLDLAPLVKDAMLRRMVEAAVTHHDLDPLEIRAYARRAGRRPGAARLVTACMRIAGPARLRSDLERAFRTFCEEHGLPSYEANVPFQRWELDVFWRKYGVVAELDWYRWHGAQTSYRTDRKKGLALEAAGLHLVRVAGEDLEESPTDVFAALTAAIDRGARHTGLA